jgi:hypothetical protein
MTQSSNEVYRFNATYRVYVPLGHPEYDSEQPIAPGSADGRLLAVLRSATDLSHGSEELLSAICNDFTRL